MTDQADIDKAFVENTIERTVRRSGRKIHIIRCKKGLWSVEAPTFIEALTEALRYFRQYYLDGEYD
jgi:hypothetical protein